MKEALYKQQRQHLETVFRAGLAAVHGSHCVADFLARHPPKSRTCVVAIGKAASAMTTGALQELGERFLSGMLVTRDGHIDARHARDHRLTCLEAGHPVPDTRSLRAGDSVCRFIAALPADTDILFLISGGASSLVEVLPGTSSLRQLQQMNQWLLASGLDISAINRVRRSVSLIKGGGLLQYLHGQRATALLISDVAGDDPAAIGSGLLWAGSGPDVPTPDLPGWMLEMSGAGRRQAGSCGASCAPVGHHVVAGLGMAMKAAAVAGKSLGYATTIMHERLDGEAADTGARLIAQIRECHPGLYLWGGETTVTLPAVPGTGGRNQHLALAAACAMRDGDKIVLLSAGTDGSDGTTAAAGAIVDPGSLARGAACGLDPLTCLRQADSGSYFQATREVLLTGPTGTNVTDLVIGLKLADDPCV